MKPDIRTHILRLIGEPAMILIGTETILGRLYHAKRLGTIVVREPANTHNGGEAMSVTFRPEDILSLEWYPQHSHATIVLR